MIVHVSYWLGSSREMEVAQLGEIADLLPSCVILMPSLELLVSSFLLISDVFCRIPLGYPCIAIKVPLLG